MDRKDRPPAANDHAPFNFGVLTDSELAIFSVAGMDGYFRDVNPAFQRLLERSRSELLRHSLLELVVPEDIPRVLLALNALADGAPEFAFESRWLKRDGSEHWLSWVARRDPKSALWYGTARDVTGDRNLQGALEQARERLNLALGASQAGSWEWSRATGRMALDAGAERLFGLQPGQFIHCVADFLRAVHRVDRRGVLHRLRRLDREEEHFELVFRPQHGGDAIRHLALRGRMISRDRGGRPQRLAGIVFDVTGQKTVEEPLQNMVVRDPLTGVHNQRRLDEALRVEWQRALRNRRPLSALMIDFDDFKIYNDTYGQAAGDEALRAVSRSIELACVRPADLLARYGGEEFVVLLPDTSETAANGIAWRILEGIRCLALPHRGSSHQVVTVSVGVASAEPVESAEPASLLAEADAAMCRAKKSGRNRISH